MDLRRSLSVCWHFLHYVWDESFFLPKILKMSMGFTFIIFTVFTSLQINVTPTFLSPRASSGKKNHLFSLHAINLHHSTFLRNADPDLNENSGVSTDLDQKIPRIGGFPYPYSPLSRSDGEANCEISRTIF